MIVAVSVASFAILLKFVHKGQKQRAEEVRGHWDHKFDFVLSALGYAVGLGNVWRFPYLAYKYGGGSFVLPYTIMLVFVGLPLFFLELALGQYSQRGPIDVFGNLMPLLKGNGYAMLAISILAAIQYDVILAWSLHYFFSSFGSKLPWSDCHNAYNTEYCTPPGINMTCPLADEGECISASKEYFSVKVLNLDMDTIDWTNFGGLQWELVGCLLAAWVLVCISSINGVKTHGKVVYFTSLFPYVVFFILFAKAISLEGASDGISWYLTPKPGIMLEIEVWEKAATQIFYSLSIGLGGLITLSSYNKFHNNCHRDAVIVVICNAFTSFFAGIIVFSVLGFIAKSTGRSVEDVATEGRDLVFIVLPEGFAQMQFPHLWSILFFMMLIALGIDSNFANVETIATSLIDHIQLLRQRRGLVVMVICAFGFLLGLTMVAQGGLYMFMLIDYTTFSWNIMLFALVEVVLVSWKYGIYNFFGCLEEMNIKLWSPLKWYWIICWKFVTPVVLFILFITSVSAKLDFVIDGYSFPDGINSLGWLITSSTVAMIPILMIHQIFKALVRGEDLCSALFKPRDRWAKKETTGDEIINGQECPISLDTWGPASPDHQCEISEPLYGERRLCEEFGPSLQREILSVEMQHDPQRLQLVCKNHYIREKQYTSLLACGVTDEDNIAATNLFFFTVLGTNEITEGAYMRHKENFNFYAIEATFQTVMLPENSERALDSWKHPSQTFFDNVNNGIFFRLKRFLLKCPIMRLFENTSVAWTVSTATFLARTILYYLDLVKGSVETFKLADVISICCTIYSLLQRLYRARLKGGPQVW